MKIVENLKNKIGFTLAEVLITLGIIGVVAAMTIPTLTKNIRDHQYKVAYRKAYADLWQAVNTATSDNELAQATYPPSARPTEFDRNFITIMSKFKVQKQCTTSNNEECWDSTGEKYGSGSGYPISNGYAFIDTSGRAWSEYWYGALTFLVDTNAFQPPNQWGKDRFILRVTDKNNASETTMDIPVKVISTSDNHPGACNTDNKCGIVGDQDYHTFYNTSWLYK